MEINKNECNAINYKTNLIKKYPYFKNINLNIKIPMIYKYDTNHIYYKYNFPILIPDDEIKYMENYEEILIAQYYAKKTLKNVYIIEENYNEIYQYFRIDLCGNIDTLIIDSKKKTSPKSI
jgi:hypothetical protein